MSIEFNVGSKVKARHNGVELSGSVATKIAIVTRTIDNAKYVIEYPENESAVIIDDLITAVEVGNILGYASNATIPDGLVMSTYSDDVVHITGISYAATRLVCTAESIAKSVLVSRRTTQIDIVLKCNRDLSKLSSARLVIAKVGDFDDSFSLYTLKSSFHVWACGVSSFVGRFLKRNLGEALAVYGNASCPVGYEYEHRYWVNLTDSLAPCVLCAENSDYYKKYDGSGHNIVLMTSGDFHTFQRDFYLKPAVEVTEGDYWEMLEVLPPESYHRDTDGVTKFNMSEYWTASFTSQYATLGGKFLSKMVDVLDKSTYITAADFGRVFV